MALSRSILARFAQNLTILESSITLPDYSGVVLIIPIIYSPSRKGKSCGEHWVTALDILIIKHFIHTIIDQLII